jgi:hypothetical protein
VLVATFFTLSSENITSMLAYVGNIFTDAGLLIWVAIGLPLGFYVIKKVIALIPKR